MSNVVSHIGAGQAPRATGIWKRFARNRAAVLGLLLFAVVLAMALLADIVAPGDPLRRVADPLLGPFEHQAAPLGTDQLGRSIFAQLFHGARITLLLGVVATLVSIAIGAIVGALAGYFGGIVDDILTRITDSFQTVPEFILLLTLVAIIGTNLRSIILSIGLVSWRGIARMMRAEFLSLRNREFVDAARNLGISNFSLIFREILPNAMPPVVVYSSIVMALAVLLETSLAFLGLGDQNYASWGNMIGQARSALRAVPFNAIFPGVAILVTVLSFSLVGEGLNETLNPRRKR
jgi:peptide/nickel transport system permease protein